MKADQRGLNSKTEIIKSFSPVLDKIEEQLKTLQTYQSQFTSKLASIVFQ